MLKKCRNTSVGVIDIATERNTSLQSPLHLKYVDTYYQNSPEMPLLLSLSYIVVRPVGVHVGHEAFQERNNNL